MSNFVLRAVELFLILPLNFVVVLAKLFYWKIRRYLTQRVHHDLLRELYFSKSSGRPENDPIVDELQKNIEGLSDTLYKIDRTIRRLEDRLKLIVEQYSEVDR